MVERLEMVVSGQRQVAMPSVPESLTGISPSNGFLVEEHRLSTFELPDHWIPFYMVGLQFTPGNLTRFFVENGKSYKEIIENEGCFVVGPRELRRFRIEGTGNAVMVSIEPGVLGEMIVGSPRRSPLELLGHWRGHDPVLRDIVLKLRAEVNAGCPSGALLGESICTKLAEELIQRYSIGRAVFEPYKGGLSGARLRRALEYIDEYLNLNLSGDSIATVAGLSKYHFGKAFKQSTGMTLHSYVLNRRISRSRELLARSDLPLAAVAAAAGFSNQSHLTTVFSTRIGMSPRTYRQNRRPVSASFRTSPNSYSGDGQPAGIVRP
jgi:AraC family transcriptional regulator